MAQFLSASMPAPLSSPVAIHPLSFAGVSGSTLSPPLSPALPPSSPSGIVWVAPRSAFSPSGIPLPLSPTLSFTSCFDAYNNTPVEQSAMSGKDSFSVRNARSPSPTLLGGSPANLEGSGHLTAGRPRAATSPMVSRISPHPSPRELFPAFSPSGPAPPTGVSSMVEFAERSEQGMRPTQEDTTSFLRVSDSCVLFELFDGHVGDEASVFCQKDMLRNCAMNLASSPTPTQALALGFMKTERHFMDWALQTGNEAGTTALVCCLDQHTLHVAHCGDSRAILAKQGHPNHLVLTQDHRPNVPEEHVRVLQAGGTVERSLGDCLRVMPGGFAFTRSIGDRTGKLPAPLLNAIPEINTFPLTGDLRYIVMACDGVWDVLSPAQVADIALCTSSARQCADAIAREALRHGTTDNVTVIAIKLGPPPQNGSPSNRSPSPTSASLSSPTSNRATQSVSASSSP